jgi:hypothetical protein
VSLPSSWSGRRESTPILASVASVASAAFEIKALALTQAKVATSAGSRLASAPLIIVVAARTVGILSYAAITTRRATAGEPASLARYCSHDLVQLIARVTVSTMNPPNSEYVDI